MKIKLNTKNLNKILSVLMKTVSSKNTIPILDNFLVKVEPEKVTFTASDLETTITATVPALEIDTKGKVNFAVPAKVLSQLLSNMPEGEMTIEHIADTANVNISWSNGSSSLPVFNWIDYPEIKGVNPVTDKILFGQGFLKSALNKTVSIINTGDTANLRPALGGVYFDLKKEGTTIVGTDSHMISCVETPVEGENPFILPAKAAMLLKSMLDNEGEISVVSDGKNAEFTFGNFWLQATLINAKFPNYKVIIPDNNPNIMKVKKDLLTAVLKRMMVCANNATKVITFNLSYNIATVNAQDLAFAISAKEEMPCEYDGEDMEIGFKATAFLQILNNLDSDEIEIRFMDSKKATLIIPTEENYKNEPVKSVIMPCLIK